MLGGDRTGKCWNKIVMYTLFVDECNKVIVIVCGFESWRTNILFTNQIYVCTILFSFLHYTDIHTYKSLEYIESGSLSHTDCAILYHSQRSGLYRRVTLSTRPNLD